MSLVDRVKEILARKTASPIIPTAVALPPMGMFYYSCTYTSKANTGNVETVYNPVGYTPSAQEENHPSFGVYTRVQMAIDIPLVLLGSYVPKPGDFFIGPDGYVYNVLKRQTASIFFCRVVGLCPTLSYNLTDKISIKPPVDSTDAYLSPKTAIGDTPILDAIDARIQFIKNELEDFQGTQYLRPTYHVWVATDVDFPIGTLVMPSTGKYLGKIMRVVDNTSIENLASLEQLTVTIDPI